MFIFRIDLFFELFLQFSFSYENGPFDVLKLLEQNSMAYICLPFPKV